MIYGMRLKIASLNIAREVTEFQQGLAILGIKSDTAITEKFIKMVKILYEYKDKFHLLSHGDYNFISKRHFLPSVMVLPYINDFHSICDIGAGAGFPSVPLKILRPQIFFTLFEANRKKAEFLKYLIAELELLNVQIVNERAENYQGEKFDAILIKAAGKIKSLIKTIDQLIIPGGCAIFYKSHRVEDEIKLARKKIIKLGFQIQVEKLYTPIEHRPLALIFLKKMPSL